MSDTISRQAAIRWIKAECNPYGKPTLDYETSCRIMEHLDRMPSAEPERLTDDDFEGIIWDREDRPTTCITGCALRREVCAIALDLNVEGLPTNAEDVLKGFSNVPERELATIRANVEQFFRTLEVKKDDRY